MKYIMNPSNQNSKKKNLKLFISIIIFKNTSFFSKFQVRFFLFKNNKLKMWLEGFKVD